LLCRASLETIDILLASASKLCERERDIGPERQVSVAILSIVSEAEFMPGHGIGIDLECDAGAHVSC
jgi:hypothetical protein